ncbi:AMP-binding protein [Nocardioides sp. ChNu-153]|uniref:AMP-binding protein n=1 Tax=unclassified Nocardioides TaxID=2615069 RepID=UPI002406B67C|nr:MULTISPECIES: AMP-binding protein [unclassified Nocardioides]MDF9716745.1 AMP-binding protein [Nocardioides sp. ChNu-99]MDN7121957.1 AMP-binding protein [Nocardioides sp. ChNu-153]
MSSLRPVAGPPASVVEALAAWLEAPAEPEPLIVETSGSTGSPKRVVLSRRAVRASGEATAAVLGARGQWLLALPATYVAGVQVVARSLAAGHRPVLLDDHPGFAAAAAAMTPGVPHLVSLVPTQLFRLLDDPEATAALRGFHTVLLGGGPIDPELRERAAAAGVRVVATYGSAETAGGCVYDGWPLPGVRLRLEDDGRLAVAGPTLFDGYDGDPALTAEVLVDGWFRTSDAGRLTPDGRLELLGRVDDLVVSGGVNVPTPVVARRLREHPDVAAAEVLGVEDPEWGQRVVAWVVPAASSGAPASDLDALRDWVAAAHPRAWAPRQLVVIDAVPLLPNGKTDRLALRGMVEG